MPEVRQRKKPETISDISDEDILIPKEPSTSSCAKDTCIVLSALILLLLGMSYVVTQTFTFGYTLPNIQKYIPVNSAQTLIGLEKTKSVYP
jgi:hypothetical protein